MADVQQVLNTSVQKTVRNNNEDMTYAWMINEYGVEVAIAKHQIQWALKQHFRFKEMNPDGTPKLHTDRHEDHHNYGKEMDSNNPIERLAKLMEMMMQLQMAQNPQMAQLFAEMQSKAKAMPAPVAQAPVAAPGAQAPVAPTAPAKPLAEVPADEGGTNGIEIDPDPTLEPANDPAPAPKAKKK